MGFEAQYSPLFEGSGFELKCFGFRAEAFRVEQFLASSGRALEPSASSAKIVAEVDSSCRLLIVPNFRGSSRFESLVLSHHSRFTCECNKEEINDDDDASGFRVQG